MHCVDLGESFPTSIFLLNLASIQPRTSLVKFARSPRTDPPGGDAEEEGPLLLRGGTVQQGHPCGVVFFSSQRETLQPEVVKQQSNSRIQSSRPVGMEDFAGEIC